MQLPILEIRQNNVFVLSEWWGQEIGDTISYPYNRIRNLTKYIVDSSGKVWELSHLSHDCKGLKKYISPLWNVCKDTYSVRTSLDKDVSWLKAVLEQEIDCSAPDLEELRYVLIKDLEKIEGHELLSTAVEKLNL